MTSMVILMTKKYQFKIIQDLGNQLKTAALFQREISFGALKGVIYLCTSTV